MFGTLPTAIGSHVSALIEDRYLVVYGGTNGLRFFDSILRYDIEDKQWTLMTKQPNELKGSSFFSDGRIACSVDQCQNSFGLVFGGCSAESDCNEFMVISFNHMKDSANFSQINEIF